MNKCSKFTMFVCRPGSRRTRWVANTLLKSPSWSLDREGRERKRQWRSARGGKGKARGEGGITGVTTTKLKLGRSVDNTR